jgi:hypothetical protein
VGTVIAIVICRVWVEGGICRVWIEERPRVVVLVVVPWVIRHHHRPQPQPQRQAGIHHPTTAQHTAPGRSRTLSAGDSTLKRSRSNSSFIHSFIHSISRPSMRPPSPSIPEKDFFFAALDQNLRLDGREFLEARAHSLSFGAELGHVECSLGKTRYGTVLVRATRVKRNARVVPPHRHFFSPNYAYILVCWRRWTRKWCDRNHSGRSRA